MYLYDIDATQLENALVAVRQQVTDMHTGGCLGEGLTVDAVCARVRACNDLATAVQGALHVQVGTLQHIWACKCYVTADGNV